MPQDTKTKSRGTLLNKVEADTDSDVPEFALPPKSIVKRTKKFARKRKHSNWRKSFQNCRRYCSGVFLVLVLCACVLGISLLFWFSLRLYRDVENLSRRLTIEVNRVGIEQAENLKKCLSLEKRMTDNIKILQTEKNKILDLMMELENTHLKISHINGTLHTIFSSLHSPNSLKSVSRTVIALQKGMADTGAEITKINHEIKQLKVQKSLHSRAIKECFLKWNISLELSNITGKSMFSGNINDFVGKQLYMSRSLDEDNLNKSILKKSVISKIMKTLNRSLISQMKEILAEDNVLKNLSEHIETIPLLWKELQLQNQSIYFIRNLIDQHKLYKSKSQESTSHFTGDPATPIEGEFEEDPQKNKKRDSPGAAYDENTSNQGTDYFNRFHKLMDDDVT
ncbi:uncharacterized protein LOC124441574 isoform X2 [Xenia sp. Carnegie-2017]|uniref:uncharacterized protein LOC124441574 isoform X2 n=1 Tax=Xenia sp. Carnegie-2017 TaxID=2897299 RepID=UPI001F049B73|nr:uncharacterized protein LOC124441574 isoform X2 [Xenia sp. Carnegie-2017]